MPKFAIVRQDGAVDVADGASVADIASRYGWPGDGDIRPYAGEPVRHLFDDPAHQAKIWADAQTAEDERVASVASAGVDINSPEFRAAVASAVAEHLTANPPPTTGTGTDTGGSV